MNDDGAQVLRASFGAEYFAKTLLCTLGRWNELAATNK